MSNYNRRNLNRPVSQVHLEAEPPQQLAPMPQGGKENRAFSVPGKHSLVMNLQKTVAKKGSPGVLAPGNTRWKRDCQSLKQAMTGSLCKAKAWLMHGHSEKPELPFPMEM